MKDGFITLSRRFFAHHFWEESRPLSKAEAFLDLIQRANYADNKVMVGSQSIAIKRGEQVASLRFLATRWQWSAMKVKRFISVLETEHMTRQETRQGQTILTLCNYDNYNGKQSFNETPNETPNETATRQQRDTSETKQKKRIKKTITALPFSSNSFKEAWSDWEQHRKEKRKPITETAKRKQLDKLKAMGEELAIATLIHSTTQGWEGLYPPKAAAGQPMPGEPKTGDTRVNPQTGKKEKFLCGQWGETI